MEYVTYAPDGKLTGSYSQALHPAHAGNHIVVTPEQRLNWTALRANAGRNGVEPAPAPVPAPVVPEAVPMLNAKLAMTEAGWMADVEAHMAAIPGVEGKKARVFFAEALTMRRDHPLVTGISAALGKTQAQVDALFIAAAALEV